MTHSFRRTASTLLAVLFAATALVVFPAVAGARSTLSIKSGIYDCWAYSTYGFVYGGSYKFSVPGQYQYAGLSKNGRLVGKIATGTYAIQGKKLVPRSGPMKKNHFYLVVKNQFVWTLWNANGKPTGMACYWKKAK